MVDGLDPSPSIEPVEVPDLKNTVDGTLPEGALGPGTREALLDDTVIKPVANAVGLTHSTTESLKTNDLLEEQRGVLGQWLHDVGTIALQLEVGVAKFAQKWYDQFLGNQH